MNKQQQMLVDLYLEYVNDYITLATMAEHKEISLPKLTKMVSQGKRLHEINVKTLKKGSNNE